MVPHPWLLWPVVSETGPPLTADGPLHRSMGQLARASALHDEYMERIASQQQRLGELTRSELRLRQQGFNQSLEQFKRQYDETW